MKGPRPPGSGVRLLIVDDEEPLRALARRMVEPEGYGVEEAPSGEEALRVLERAPLDLVLCDVRMKGMSGIDLTRKIRERNPDAAVIVMSAYGSVELALEALAAGAIDFLFKPYKREELLFRLGRAAQFLALRRENRDLRKGGAPADPLEEVVAVSLPMRAVVERVRKVAPFKTTVLLTGESGTGKELIARTLHRLSPRAGHPFVAVNCGAIPEHLLESELFGHARGAFTGAVRAKAGLFDEAHQGSLLLDEVGDLPPPLQVKLLRVLQEGEVRRVGENQPTHVDVRVLAATARDLGRAAATGGFREDLYYRLNVVSIALPPLRERREDIPALVERILRKIGARLGREVPPLSPQALQAAVAGPWRGNVRELENALERAAVLSTGNRIEAGDLAGLEDAVAGRSLPPPGGRGGEGDDLSVKRLGRELESQLIRKALERTRGNRTLAAKLLEMSLRALHYKMKAYGISPGEGPEEGGGVACKKSEGPCTDFRPGRAECLG